MAKQEGEPTGKFAFLVQTGSEVTSEGTVNTGFIAASDNDAANDHIKHLREAHGIEVFRGRSPMSEAVNRSVGMPGENGWGAKWQPKGPEGGTPLSRAEAEIKKRAARANEN